MNAKRTEKNMLQEVNKDSLAKLLQQGTLATAEVLTGILASEENQWKLSTGRIIQAVIKCNFLNQLGKEIKLYQKTGRIKQDYLETDKNRATLYELLNFLDTSAPDEELFNAMKSIFFSGVSSSATEKDHFLAYEFIKTAKLLSGTEIVILKANYELAIKKFLNQAVREKFEKSNRYRNGWRSMIASQLDDLSLDAMVDKYEQNLEDLGLVSRRYTIERSGNEYEYTPHYRLTNIGYQFCQFIIAYE